MCDGGRDLEGAEYVEYCDSLPLDACEVGRCKFDRRAGGDVISGGSGGWFGFEAGEETGVVEDGDDTASIAGDITAVIFAVVCVWSLYNGVKSRYQLDLFRSRTNWRKLASKPWIAPGVDARTKGVEDSRAPSNNLDHCAARPTGAEMVSDDSCEVRIRRGMFGYRCDRKGYLARQTRFRDEMFRGSANSRITR